MTDRFLTQREEEVLRLLAKGFSNYSIAETMGISYHSASNYCTRCYSKLGLPKSPDYYARVVAALMWQDAETFGGAFFLRHPLPNRQINFPPGHPLSVS